MRYSQNPSVKQQIRNLQILRLGTAAHTMRVFLMDLPIAVISYVFMYFYLAIRKFIHRPRVQSKPAGKTAKEGAFKESVEWFIRYVQ